MQSCSDMARPLALIVPAAALVPGDGAGVWFGRRGGGIRVRLRGDRVGICLGGDRVGIRLECRRVGLGWHGGRIRVRLRPRGQGEEKASKKTLKRFMVLCMLCMLRLPPRFVKPKTRRRARR